MAYTCPICGSPHDTEGGVVQHMFASKDDAHADVTDKKEAWRMMLDGDNEDSTDESNDNVTYRATQERGTGESQGSTSKGGIVPYDPPSSESSTKRGTADSHNSNDSNDTTEWVECPRCGSTDEVIPAAKYLGKFATELDESTKETLRDSDCVCWSCGGVFDV